MSFKREGDDVNLLSILRKRRIKELLSEDIPADEAKLLCNGRFACTVCPHNPIFDTVNILNVHRNGKKHLSYLETYKEKKREVQQLKTLRKHETFLNNGFLVTEHTQSTNGLLLTSPYNPRVKRIKRNSGEQRQKINLNDETNSHSNSKLTPASNSITHKSHWTVDVCKQQMEGPILHDCKLKNIFSSKTEAPTKLEPYLSTRRTAPETSTSSCSNQGFIEHTTQNKIRLGTGIKHQSFQINHPHHSLSRVQRNGALHKSISASPLQTTNTTKSSQDNSVTLKLKQLQGSGWKRDWDGQWIKEAGAEFDSDEEPPDIPLQISK
ncbi:sodium channel modifier 1-like [Physella acuta]|uniref:sodium channel modifier 1-like n=1 Tax=Physella acuta TaxID=109671 RepID=UPI0027DCBD34|nr:sodium channel modifier 1-like [Physella acuta]